MFFRAVEPDMTLLGGGMEGASISLRMYGASGIRFGSERTVSVVFEKRPCEEMDVC